MKGKTYSQKKAFILLCLIMPVSVCGAFILIVLLFGKIKLSIIDSGSMIDVLIWVMIGLPTLSIFFYPFYLILFLLLLPFMLRTLRLKYRLPKLLYWLPIIFSSIFFAPILADLPYYINNFSYEANRRFGTLDIAFSTLYVGYLNVLLIHLAWRHGIKIGRIKSE